MFKDNYEFCSIKEFPDTESVVAMSVYSGDRLQWLKSSVDSILSQTYENFLFAIVIDGGISTDISDYLQALNSTHDNVLLIRGEKCLGLASAMNFVIEYSLSCEANYFFRMDSDDIAFPERLEQQVKLLSDKNDIDILGTALIEIDENGKKVGLRKFPEHHQLLYKIMPLRCPINHPTVVIRTRVFQDGFRYDEDKLNTQDYFLWVELAGNGYRFSNIREPLLYYRRVKGFYKRRGKSKSLNEFKARFFAMRTLNGLTFKNIVYAHAVLLLRMMPSFIVKLAYKFDRKFIHGKSGYKG